MNPIDRSKNLMFLSAAICGICVALLAIIMVLVQLKSMNRNTNQISIDGVGYVNVVPNIAVINLNVREVAGVTIDAQNAVKEKVQNVLKSLSDLEINPEDIKTESYNLVPKYDYPQALACLRVPCPPAPKPVLLGYEASQSILVKVRAINKIDSIFELFGKLKITEFFGPNFVIDDLGKSKEEAKVKAIADAKIKAVKLANDLGIRLGHITSFNDQGTSFQPALPGSEAKMMMSSSSNSSNINSITPGENKITSNVVITYEIQ